MDIYLESSEYEGALQSGRKFVVNCNHQEISILMHTVRLSKNLLSTSINKWTSMGHELKHFAKCSRSLLFTCLASRQIN